MISNYTIGSPKDIDSIKRWNTIQFVFNRRQFPSQRNYPAILKGTEDLNTKIIGAPLS